MSFDYSGIEQQRSRLLVIVAGLTPPSEKSASICVMEHLSIPREYRRGFAALLKLEADQVRELASTLEKGQTLRSRVELQVEMAADVESIGRRDLEEIIDTPSFPSSPYEIT